MFYSHKSPYNTCLCQDDKSDGTDDDSDEDEDDDDDEAMEEEDEDDGEEEEDEEMEGAVDQNFRLELMKVLQQQNALVGVQVVGTSWCRWFVCTGSIQQFNCCKRNTDVTNCGTTAWLRCPREHVRT